MNFQLKAILIGLTASPTVSHAQSGSPFLTGRNLDWLGYHSGALYWKATCLAGVGPPGVVERTPSGLDAVHSYFAPATCNAFGVRSQNIAMDAARNVYWATTDGRIVTLGPNAGPADTPVVLGQMASLAGPQVVTISVSAAYVYWAESFGELRESGTIYRIPIAGGARQTVITLTQAGGGGAVALQAMGINGLTFGESILYQRSFGKFARGVEQAVLPGQEPFTEATLAATIDIFQVVGSRAFYAETSSGAATLIRSRNATTTGLANIQTHATLLTAGSPRVSDLTADPVNVYWREVRSNTGPIWRKPLNFGTPEAITLNIPNPTGERIFLQSDTNHLFWRASQTEIRHLPTSVIGIVFDLQALDIEVVQAIQGPANDVPLVADKATWVRTFGQYSVTGAQVSYLQRLSLAQLHGTRGGVPLPGSPLQPVGGDGTLYPSPPGRHFEECGSWFRLPSEWTAAGPVMLRAEFNADHLVNESNFANNSTQVSVTFTSRSPIHLKAYPLRTPYGTLGSYQSRYQAAFDLAEAMLPTPRLTVEFGGSTIEEWNPPLPWDFGPYELSKSDDDSDWVMFKLGLRAVFSTAIVPGLEFLAGYNVHHVAFFPPFEDRFKNGYGRVGNPKVLISFMGLADAGTGFNEPRAGPVLAHEMGHNYGRKHVNCGNPTGIDYGYLYDPCKLAGAVEYQGWNPFARQVIRGGAAGDLMSYAGRVWTSDYTWKAIYNQLGAGFVAPGAGGAEARGSNDPMLLGAVVGASGIAEIHPAIPLPDAVSQANANTMVSEAEDQTTWQFAIRRANGTLITAVPAGASEVSDGGSLLVFAVTGEQPEAASVVLEKNNAPGIPQATLLGGGEAPSLALTEPVAGTVANGPLTIRWTADDPEGQPLRFQVRHTHDGGANWTMIADEVRLTEFTVDAAELPGGGADEARIEVLASDGLRTAVALSDPFTIAPKNPRPLIVLETERGRSCGTIPIIAAGESLVARGSANDREDGPLPDTSLSWTLTPPAGPARNGVGREFYLRDLLPGTHALTLKATDSDGQNATVNALFVVRPIAMEKPTAAPVVDGSCDDPAYFSCLHPIPIRELIGETPAAARSVLFGTTLYVAVSGIPVGSPASSDAVAIALDPNDSGDDVAQANDIRFLATRDGSFRSLRGDGSGGFAAQPVTSGFTVRVSGDATRWEAEFSIPLSTIGTSAGQIVGMDVQHFRPAAPGPAYFSWFGGTTDTWYRPRFWAKTLLGPDPDDPADYDLDGMADAWEIANFGSALGPAGRDSDGDGQSDGAEYQAGTNPNSRTSVFTVQALVEQGAFRRIDWLSANGRTYTVETSDTLTEWYPYCEGLLGNGTMLSCLIDPTRAEAGDFYRIRAARCP